MSARLNLVLRSLQTALIRQGGETLGNKQAIATAVDAQKVELKPSDVHDLLSLDIDDTDRQGGVSFRVL